MKPSFWLMTTVLAIGCGEPPIEELPEGTFDLDLHTMAPPGLDTDTATVTITKTTVEFDFTTHDGVARHVVYRREDAPEGE